MIYGINDINDINYINYNLWGKLKYQISNIKYGN